MLRFVKQLLCLLALYGIVPAHSQTCLPGTVPYTENFDNVTPPALPPCTSADNISAAGTWGTTTYNLFSSPNVLRHTTTNYSRPEEDWYFLKGLTLTAGVSYLLTFNYAPTTPNNPEKLEVRVGTTPTASAALASGISIFNLTNITVNGTGRALFTPSANGIYYFGFRDYTNFTGLYFYIDDITVTEAPACTAAPTNIITSAPDTNRITIAYNAAGNNVLIEYGLLGFVPGTGATAGTGGTIVTANSSQATLTGLAAGTSYDVYVRQNCTTPGGGYSANSVKASFSTLCSPVRPPYFEYFDGTTAPAIPTCIAVENVNGSNTWITSQTSWPGTSTPNVMTYWSNYATPADDWFFVKGVRLTAGLPYYVYFRYSGMGSSGEKMEVRVGTAPNAAAALAGPQIYNDTLIKTTGFANGYFTPATTGVYYFGFHAYSSAFSRGLYVDNVSVRLVCTPTTTPVVDSVTTGTASVSFSSIAPANNYIVEYGPAGFSPGTDGGTSSDGRQVTGTASPIRITGLADGTRYDVYVRQNCGTELSGYSANSPKASFTTVCGTATLPYTENFDRAAAPALPPCITVENTNGVGTWEVVAATPASYFSAPNTIKYTPDTAVAANDWFFTKALNLTAGSTYKLAFYFSGNALEVRAATAATSTAAMAGLQIFNYNNTTPFTGGGTGEFTPTVSGTYYLGFHVYSAASQPAVYVDNINVTRTVACALPANAGVDSITTTTFRVNFSPAGNPVIIEYRTTRNTPGTGANPGAGGVVVSATTSPVLITGLTLNTKYYVYIRQNCTTPGNGYSNNQLIDSLVTDALPPANDLPTGAIVLQIGAGCSNIACTNGGATKTIGEPGVPSSGSQAAGKSVWYKFRAPAGGFVRISTDADSNTLADTKIALYAVSDSSDFSSFQVLACDDDNGVLNSTASILYATDLVAGRFYYIVVDDYDGVHTGKFCLKIDEVTTAMIAGTGSCTEGQTVPEYLGSYKGWASLANNSGQLIANVRLRDTVPATVSYTPYLNINMGPLRQAATGEYYADRNFRIGNAPVANYELQLFLLNTELARLQTAVPAGTLTDLNTTRVRRDSGCSINFISGGSGRDTLLLQTTSGTASNVSWMRVNTNELPNFYLHFGNQQLSRLYVFNGNGAWSNPANWSNNEVPPVQLPGHCAIEIKPSPGGQCILDVPQYVPAGSILRVKSGMNIVIPGSIRVQ